MTLPVDQSCDAKWNWPTHPGLGSASDVIPLLRMRSQIEQTTFMWKLWVRGSSYNSPLPLTLVKHCKYKRGSFDGQLPSLSHLRPPPPLCLCAFTLHSSGAWHALSWYVLSCLGPGSEGAVGRILRRFQDFCSLVFIPFTVLIGYVMWQRWRDFADVVEVSSQLILSSSKGRLSWVSLI